MLLPKQIQKPKEQGYGEAPVNIALIKYWGKRCPLLNLPVTDSLSVTVPDTLTKTVIRAIDGPCDKISLNQTIMQNNSSFYKRTCQFLDLFRNEKLPFFEIETQNSVATAAGLASSASGFAALVLALNDLFQWQLSLKHLSILARMGSGSACRSFWPGFVHWHAGMEENGMDSFAEPLAQTWPDLMLALVIVNQSQKPISSRDAMQQTVRTSPLYEAWPNTVAKHLIELKQAIAQKDFAHFGQVAEQQALAMHATMLASWPSIDYRLEATLASIHRVYELRQAGVPVYFTQDAGPNIKLLFEARHQAEILQVFPAAIVKPLFL